MALITCQECGKEISEKASACPSCGAPTNQEATPRPISTDVEKEQKKKESALGIWGMIFSLICCFPIFPFAGIILCIIALTKKDRKTTCAKLGIVFAIISFIIGFSVFGNSEDTESKNNKNIEDTSFIEETKQTPTPEINEEQIEYIKCNVDEMIELLESNALKAEKTYQGQYIEVTGKLSVIDSDGKYISLKPINDEWALIGIQCTIENEEQLNQVIELSKDDIVTVKVKCESIGEVLGYYGYIIEFVK